MSCASVRVGRNARRIATDQRVNEVGDGAGRRFGEINELDTRSVEHPVTMKMSDRGMDGAALDDHGASAQCQAKIVQRSDGKCRGRIDLRSAVEVCATRIDSTTVMLPGRSSSMSVRGVLRGSLDMWRDSSARFFGL